LKSSLGDMMAGIEEVMKHLDMVNVLLRGIPLLAAGGGLVYAALQFRGWQTAQYVANFTKLVELQLQLRRMALDDPSLVPWFQDPAKEMRSFFYMLMELSLFEIAWFSHRHGQLTDDYFASWEVSFASIARRPEFRAMWQSDRTKILHDGFRQYMDTLIERSS